MTRLIDADALLEAIKNKYGANGGGIIDLITNAPTVQHEGWVSVEDRLPENDRQVMAWVKDKDNKFGGYRELVNYGHYDFYTFDDDHPNADEEGLVSRTGWYYGRESEGEFDYLIFELDGKVTHWTTVPDIPATPKD
jgi:hypothetical protein